MPTCLKNYTWAYAPSYTQKIECAVKVVMKADVTNPLLFTSINLNELKCTPQKTTISFSDQVTGKHLLRTDLKRCL